MKPFNEWSEKSSDRLTVLASDASGNVYKVAEWQLISNKKMLYIRWNKNGSINTKHEFETTPEAFKKYILHE